MSPESAQGQSLRTALFSFKGRLSRSRLWEYTILTNIVSAVVLFAIAVLFFQIASAERADGSASGRAAISMIIIAALYFTTFLWIWLALLWKRFHDRGRTGWFALIGVVPIVGFLWIVVDAYFLPGKTEANHYGPVPIRSPRLGFAEVGFVGAGMIALVVLFLMGRTFVMEPFNVPSASNEPTIAAGEYVMVSRYAYRLGEPRLGDFVVFINPRTGEDYLKRIVGLPGDTVQLRRGIVAINGQKAVRSRIDNYTQRTWVDRFQRFEDDARYRYSETLPGGQPHEILGAPAGYPEDSMPQDNTQLFNVPAGHFFAIGDNRDNSNDSRFGPVYVPIDNLVGRAEFIYLSRTPGTPSWNIYSFLAGVRWNRMLKVVP